MVHEKARTDSGYAEAEAQVGTSAEVIDLVPPLTGLRPNSDYFKAAIRNIIAGRDPFSADEWEKLNPSF